MVGLLESHSTAAIIRQQDGKGVFVTRVCVQKSVTIFDDDICFQGQRSCELLLTCWSVRVQFANIDVRVACLVCQYGSERNVIWNVCELSSVLV